LFTFWQKDVKILLVSEDIYSQKMQVHEMDISPYSCCPYTIDLRRNTMSRKIYRPQMEPDPNMRQVADLNQIAIDMNSSEAINLIGKESAFLYNVLASEYDVPDEMLKEIFFTDVISDDLLYVCDTLDPDARTIDIKTFTNPDTDQMYLGDILKTSSKDDILIATPGSNYIIVATTGELVCEPIIKLYVWDLRKSSIF